MENEVLLQFEVECFEKADEGDRSRRIGGYASTEHLDKQGEILVQSGLSFDEFTSSGWLNNNHGKDIADVIGYPTKAEYHVGRGWYIEGFLLKGTKQADSVWETANALQRSNRRLGFSVEGHSAQKIGNKVTKAIIKNVAVTHCPVNQEAVMQVLAKSLSSLEDSSTDETVLRSLTAGYDSPVGSSGGAALKTQDLDTHKVKNTDLENVYCEKCHKPCTCMKKSEYDKKEILQIISNRGYSENQVEFIYEKLLSLHILKPVGGN